MIRRSLASLCLVLACSCDDEPEDTGPRAANACVPDARGDAWSLEDATTDGPFRAGEHTYVFVDSTRPTLAHGDYAGAPDRTLDTKVFYPATSSGPDAPRSTDGPFPVVLYSHGFSSSNTEALSVSRFLATHGYVVVSPRFPASAIDAEGGATTEDIAQQPRDQSFLLDTVIALSAADDPFLGGMIDEGRVAAAGLSMGGLTTLLVAFHAQLRDPRVDLAIAMAPRAGSLLPSFYDTTDIPVLVMFGTSDAILPYPDHAVPFRDRARSPRTLISLELGTHTGFTQLAATFEGVPGYENIDALGCSYIDPADGGSSGRSDDLVSLLGAENGIENPTPTVEFCPDVLEPAMGPLRQRLLETATVRAQLDAYFANDAKTRGRACHFVERVLPREEDVSIDRR